MKFKIEIDLEVEGLGNMTVEFDLNKMIITTIDNEGLIKQEKFTKQQLPKMLNYFSSKMIEASEK